jgi:hypothetical protein
MFEQFLLVIQSANDTNESGLFDWFLKLVAGGVLAAVGKFIYDHVSGKAKSIENLLNDIKNEVPLSTSARRRVQEYADNALAEWKGKDKIAVSTGKKLKGWPERNNVVFVREFFRIGRDSACPSGDIDNPSTPFFIYLDRSEDVATQLREDFTLLESKNKFSAELIRYLKYSKGEEPKVWILAPHVKIRQRKDVIDLFNKLAKEVRHWFPMAQVALEVYLPDEIRNLGEISLVPQPHNKLIDSAHLKLDSVARYVFARNEAEELFSSGVILGKLRTPEKYRVPSKFLRDRAQEYLDLMTNLNDWDTFTLSGRPGSGKTEVANVLAGELIGRHKMIVIIASTPNLLKQLEKAPSYTNRNAAIRDLIDSIFLAPLDARLIPPQFQNNVEEQEAFRDALLNIMLEKKYPATIFVDDFHAYNKLNSALSKLCQEAQAWGLHFVLSGRTVELNLGEESKHRLLHKDCDLWTREQAVLIVKTWADGKSEQEIEEALERNWPREKDAFSIYLLRILVKQLDRPNETPSVLYQEEIKNIVSAVDEAVVGRLESQDERAKRLIEKLKQQSALNMLIQNKTAEDILKVLDLATDGIKVDPVLLFGEIAWNSHFAKKDFINVENLVGGWSILPDEQSAKDLITASLNAKIFDGNLDSPQWCDPLARDGCAALYLKDEVGKPHKDKNTPIAGMIECLYKSESIDILRLALNPSVLQKIILTVANERPDLSEVIDNLLSPEFVARLAERPDDVKVLEETLFSQAREMRNTSNIKWLALAIYKLLPLSESLDEKCRNVIAESTPDATLALAVRAVEWKDSDEYFREVGQYISTDYLSRIAADMAARLWDREGAMPLISQLVKLSDDNYDENEVKRIWSLWCARQENDCLMSLTTDFIARAEEDSEHEKVYGILAAANLEKIMAKPLDREKYKIEIKHLMGNTRALAARGKLSIASQLIKWIAFSFNPNVILKNVDWVVDPSGKFALPVKTCDPAFINEIFPKINNSRDSEGDLIFELPSSKELLGVLNQSHYLNELVRDRLGEKFSYSVNQIDRKWLVTLNGKKIEEISREQFNSNKFNWRPRLKLSV